MNYAPDTQPLDVEIVARQAAERIETLHRAMLELHRSGNDPAPPDITRRITEDLERAAASIREAHDLADWVVGADARDDAASAIDMVTLAINNLLCTIERHQRKST